MNENKKVPEDHKCFIAGINTSKIITETTFGHGDSSHECFVRCSVCGKESERFSDWGLFENSSLRAAQKDWNEKLEL